MSIAKNIFLIIVSPKMGWDEVNNCAHKTQKVLQNGFYPMLAVLAVSSFTRLLYDSVEWTFSRAIINAIIEVTSFFATYYLSSYLLGSIFHELVRSNSATTRLNNFIIYSLVYLIILQIFSNLLDGGFAPLYFLLMYIPVIVFKGLEFLGMTDDKRGVWFVSISSAFFVLFPVLFRMLLGFMVS